MWPASWWMGMLSGHLQPAMQPWTDHCPSHRLLDHLRGVDIPQMAVLWIVGVTLMGVIQTETLQFLYAVGIQFNFHSQHGKMCQWHFSIS